MKLSADVREFVEYGEFGDVGLSRVGVFLDFNLLTPHLNIANQV